jgi:hypothetical protein
MIISDSKIIPNMGDGNEKIRIDIIKIPDNI